MDGRMKAYEAWAQRHEGKPGYDTNGCNCSSCRAGRLYRNPNATVGELKAVVSDLCNEEMAAQHELGWFRAVTNGSWPNSEERMKEMGWVRAEKVDECSGLRRLNAALKSRAREAESRAEALLDGMRELSYCTVCTQCDSCVEIVADSLPPSSRQAHHSYGDVEGLNQRVHKEKERNCDTCGRSKGQPWDCEHGGDCDEFSAWKEKV